jgi:hypothetical protein
MAPGTLVENQIDDGRKLLDRLAEAGFVVRAACWLKPVEVDRWSLYIATPAVDEKGPLKAYGQVIPVLESLGDEWITSSDVTLVGAKHPIVKEALDILRRYPHRTPIRPPRSVLGGIPIEEVYVYPLGKTEVTIYHMAFPGAPVWPALLAFDPFPSEGGVWLEEEMRHRGKPGIECVVAAPQGARLERNEMGERVLTWDRHGKPMQSSAKEVWSLANLGLYGFRFLR